MKKMRLNLVLTMTAVATVLVACQPKDVTVNKPGAATTNSVTTMNSVEINKLLAVSIERQMEPLYLVKAILNSQYATDQGLALTTDATTQVTTLSAVKDLKVFDTPAYSSEYALKYEVQTLVKDANGNLTLLLLKNKPMELIQTAGYIKTGKKDSKGKEIVTNISSKAKSELVLIKLTQTPGVYSVEVSRSEETNSAADKKNSVSSTILSTIEWDGSVAALDNDIPMKLTALYIDRIGNKNTTLKYDQITAAQPILVKVGTCMSATGSVTLSQKSTEKGADKMTPAKMVDTVVNLNDSSMEIGALSSPAKDCATRPVIDLTRIL